MQPEKQPQEASTPRAHPSSQAPRRLQRHRRGVSEVIGTILILSLTVVLFAAIFYFVSTLPPPPASSTSSFQAVLGLGVSPTPWEGYVNITYLSGPTLTSAGTQIYLSSSAHPANFACARLGQYGNPYTTSQGLVGTPSTWKAGQTWSLHLVQSVTVCPGAPGALSAAGDNITISIVNINQNILLFHVVLPGTAPSVPPIFYNYGVSQPGLGGTNQNYTIYTSIRSSDLNYNSVYVNLASIPGAPAVPVRMNYSGVTGQWTFTELGGATTPICCSPYSFVINATDNGTFGVPGSAHHNSVAFTYTFPSSANTASLLISLTLSVGNPTVGQNVVLTATVGDNGGASASNVVVTFSSSATGPIGSPTTFPTVSSGTPVPNPIYDALANWVAGPHDGSVNITATASSPSGSSVFTTVSVTVFPRTLLIDESGVAVGLNASLDTFTYLETALNSADIPYNATIVVPGSSVIGWGCSAPTCLNRYDVVIWLLSNNGALSPSDINALNCATGSSCVGTGPGHRSIWIVGANALQGANGLYANLGISASALSTFTSAQYPQIRPVGATIPAAGVFGTNMYLNGWLAGSFTPSLAHYFTITTTTAQPVYQTTVGSNTVATAYNGTWKALAMPFELSTVSMTMPWGGTTYQTSLGQQASVAYDAFNWLANFTALSPHRNGNDWAVSEVDIQPDTLTFNTPAYVNVTVRNNGPATNTITAEVLVDNLPLFIGGSAVTMQLTPSPEGGVARGTFNWTPTFVGYLTVGIEILPPPSDLSQANNIMQNSLFATQLYVHYNVLLVDATKNTGVLHHQTTPYVYNALIADGYPASTITQVALTSGCASLPAAITAALSNSPPRYNLVVWNLGDTTNSSGNCPLSHVNMVTLTTFLDNGGPSSSLLFIGNGLLTDTGDGPVVNFAGTFLGIQIRTAAALTPTGTIFGATGDQVGNGVAFPYLAPYSGAGNVTFTALNSTPNEINSFSLYYNDPDFWTVPSLPNAAGASAYSFAAGWHTAFWGFNLASVHGSGGDNAVNLALLRFSTFAGRLLPKANAVVDAPDITFATVSQPWTNFDQMHPQLDQQYLIRANVTNLGGASAFSVGIQVFDGSHILGSNSVTIGPSFSVTGGLTFISTGTVSVSWTPLYGYTNPIAVKITTANTASVLPGVAQSAEWNVTVYFFYDPTTSNENQWTHDQLLSWNKDGSGSPPVGQQIYYSDDSNIPTGDMTGNNPGPNQWGQDDYTCFVWQWYCYSMLVLDDNSNVGGGGGSVRWIYSHSVTLVAGETSAQADWWQAYSFAPYQSGGVVCVVPTGTTCPGPGLLNAAHGIVTPGPGYTGTLISGGSPACEVVPSFTGANTGFVSNNNDPAGGTPASWQYEQVNLSSMIPASGTRSIRIGFGFVEGTTACGGSGAPLGLGWWIDQFKVRESGGPTATQSYGGGCPGSAGGGVSNDLWRIAATLPGSFPGAAPPTGSAWVSGATGTNTLSMNANMWDSLYSRPIDLSNAANATLSFSYLWSRQSANGDPPMGFIVEVTPVLPNGQTSWVQVWTANVINGVTAGTNDHAWHFAKVDLTGYLGDVIRIRFLVGTNCGLDGDDPSTYPLPQAGEAALVSGVYIQGATNIAAGVGGGPVALPAPRTVSMTPPVRSVPTVPGAHPPRPGGILPPQVLLALLREGAASTASGPMALPAAADSPAAGLPPFPPSIGGPGTMAPSSLATPSGWAAPRWT